MARMIPDLVRSDAPLSERRVFERLRGEPGTDDWVVLHSLGLWNSYTGAYGELDFVILVPGAGVVCVEVKGGGVQCRDGIWWTTPFGGEPQQLGRSPFEQAKSAMWKLLAAVRKKFGDLSAEAQCPFGWLVVFPNVACPPTGTEFTRADVIDENDLRAAVTDRILKAPSIQAAAKNRVPPTKGTIQRLLSFFRPDFDRIPTAGSTIGPITEQLNSLTEEQYSILDSVVENERSIVQGYAGTGKTTLAIELARRWCLKGNSVLLCCFNKLLGTWLESRSAEFGPGRIVAGSIHHLLRDRIGRSSYEREFRYLNESQPDYWNEKYYLFGALAVAELGERFDLLIVDETQDFPVSNFMVLANEWTSPKTVLLGDFTRQAIYGASGRPFEEARAALGAPALFKLTKNCRNTQRIATCNAAVCELDAAAYHDRLPEGAPVTVHLYGDAESLRRSLTETIKILQAERVRKDDIVVLGRYQLEKSSLAETSPGQRTPTTPQLPVRLRSGLAYYTIHSFKGMECAAVLVVDIDDIDRDEMVSLLYVGNSRARVILHVFMNESCKESLSRKLRQPNEVRIVNA